MSEKQTTHNGGIENMRDGELFSFRMKADAVDLLLRKELEEILRCELGVEKLNHHESHYVGIESIDYGGAVTVEFKSSFMTYHMELFSHRTRMQTEVDRKLGNATDVRVENAYNGMFDDLSRSREIAKAIYYCHNRFKEKFLELSGEKLWIGK